MVCNGFFAEGYVLAEGSEAEEVLRSSHRAAFDEELTSFITPGYLDGRVFVLYGDCPCLVYGPAAENIHGFDERVSLDSVRLITRAIARSSPRIGVGRGGGLRAGHGS